MMVGLVLAGTALIFLVLLPMVLCPGFVPKAALITRGCVSSRTAPRPFLLLALPRSEQAGGHKELGGGARQSAGCRAGGDMLRWMDKEAHF